MRKLDGAGVVDVPRMWKDEDEFMMEKFREDASTRMLSHLVAARSGDLLCL